MKNEEDADVIESEIAQLVHDYLRGLPAGQERIFHKNVLLQHMPNWLNTVQRLDTPCTAAIEKSLSVRWHFYTAGKNTFNFDILNETGKPVSEKAAKQTDVAVWMSGASHTKATYVPPNSFTFTFEPLDEKPVKLRCQVNGQNVFTANGGIKDLRPGFETRAHCLGAWCVDMAETFTAICPLGHVQDVCTDGVLLACEERTSYSTHVIGSADEDHWEFSRHSQREPFSEVVHYAHDASGQAFLIYDKATCSVVKSIARTDKWMRNVSISALLQVSPGECLAIDTQNGFCMSIDIVRGTCVVLSRCNVLESADLVEATSAEALFFRTTTVGPARKRFTCVRWDWREGKPISTWSIPTKTSIVSAVSNEDSVFVASTDLAVTQLALTDGSVQATFNVRPLVSSMASLRLLMPNPHVLVVLDNVQGCFTTWDVNRRELVAASRHTDLLRLQFSCVSAFQNCVYVCSASGRIALMA